MLNSPFKGEVCARTRSLKCTSEVSISCSQVDIIRHIQG